jgi:CRP-like cAMP-binding protein
MSRLSEGRIRRVRQGEAILREGAVDKQAYQIVSGRVEIYSERSARKVVLARLGPGKWFGEMGLLTDAPRIASVVATEDAVLRVITRPAFDRLLRQRPSAVVPLLRVLVERLRAMNLKYLLALESQPSR